jgi:hypothetical protein
MKITTKRSVGRVDSKEGRAGGNNLCKFLERRSSWVEYRVKDSGSDHIMKGLED